MTIRVECLCMAALLGLQSFSSLSCSGDNSGSVAGDFSALEERGSALVTLQPGGKATLSLTNLLPDSHYRLQIDNDFHGDTDWDFASAYVHVVGPDGEVLGQQERHGHNGRATMTVDFDTTSPFRGRGEAADRRITSAIAIMQGSEYSWEPSVTWYDTEYTLTRIPRIMQDRFASSPPILRPLDGLVDGWTPGDWTLGVGCDGGSLWTTDFSSGSASAADGIVTMRTVAGDGCSKRAVLFKVFNVAPRTDYRVAVYQDFWGEQQYGEWSATASIEVQGQAGGQIEEQYRSSGNGWKRMALTFNSGDNKVVIVRLKSGLNPWEPETYWQMFEMREAAYIDSFHSSPSSSIWSCGACRCFYSASGGYMTVGPDANDPASCGQGSFSADLDVDADATSIGARTKFWMPPADPNNPYVPNPYFRAPLEVWQGWQETAHAAAKDEGDWTNVGVRFWGDPTQGAQPVQVDMRSSLNYWEPETYWDDFFVFPHAAIQKKLDELLPKLTQLRAKVVGPSNGSCALIPGAGRYPRAVLAAATYFYRSILQHVTDHVPSYDAGVRDLKNMDVVIQRVNEALVETTNVSFDKPNLTAMQLSGKEFVVQPDAQPSQPVMIVGQMGFLYSLGNLQNKLVVPGESPCALDLDALGFNAYRAAYDSIAGDEPERYRDLLNWNPEPSLVFGSSYDIRDLVNEKMSTSRGAAPDVIAAQYGSYLSSTLCRDTSLPRNRFFWISIEDFWHGRVLWPTYSDVVAAVHEVVHAVCGRVGHWVTGYPVDSRFGAEWSDPEAESAALDLADFDSGIPSYFTADGRLDMTYNTMLRELSKTLHPGVPLFDGEYHVSNRRTRYPRNAIKSAYWDSYIHGLSGSMLWTLSDELYDDVAIDASVAVNAEVFFDANRTALDIQRLSSEISYFHANRPDVQIVYSPQKAKVDAEYYKNLNATFSSMRYTGANVGFITEAKLVSPPAGQYVSSVIVLPHQSAPSSQLCAAAAELQRTQKAAFMAYTQCSNNDPPLQTDDHALPACVDGRGARSDGTCPGPSSAWQRSAPLDIRVVPSTNRQVEWAVAWNGNQAYVFILNPDPFPAQVQVTSNGSAVGGTDRITNKQFGFNQQIDVPGYDCRLVCVGCSREGGW